MSNILSCINGPRLYNVQNSNSNQIGNYNANILESIPNFTISFMKFCIGLLKWTILIWMPFVYRKCPILMVGLSDVNVVQIDKNVDNMLSFGKLMCYVATGYWTLFVIRGIGRIMNPVYTDFMLVLQRSHKDPSTENMELLSQYHFDFCHWPVQYHASEHRGKRLYQHIPKRSMNLPFFFKPLCYILAHTIGIRMAFPGCTGLINMLMARQRKDRLIQMMRTHQIKRVKLRTADLHDVEAFYKDNRHSADPHGQILVICCEGNAGFPELGNPKIPLEKNYSVIGWNHPGFGGSTGLPFPREEELAIDAVMKFALDYLRFEVHEIMLFGWSIGGYTATWAAMNYPQIRSLLLDATFDDIDKLAEKSLPMLLYPLVLATVREYIDLNVGGQMSMYNGSVRFIIRAQDEIITSEQGVKATNRGVFLLVDVLKQRYPDLISQPSLLFLWAYLGSNKYNARIILERSVNSDFCEQLLASSLRATGQERPIYPLSIVKKLTDDERSQLLVYLASKYMDEFEGTHCTELANHYFNEGWSESQLLLSSPQQN